MNEDRIDSDTLYDNEIKEEVNRIKKSNLSKELRYLASEAYWRLGHDLADGREYGVIIAANSLLHVAKALNEANLVSYTQKFIKLYQKEKPIREAEKKMEARREKKKYTPEKTFAEDLAKLNPNSKFAGQEIIHFNSLYGRPYIPNSELILLYGYPDSKPRPYPYLVGKDKRNAGEIWESIKPLILERIMEMLENDVVRHDWNAQVDYVGKLESGNIIIAKELILPKKFKKEVARRKKIEESEPHMSLQESVLSGKLFVDLKDSNLFEQRLIRILQKEGVKIGDRTVVDISMHAGKLSYPHSIELMEKVIDVFKSRGYKLENLPWMGYGLFYKSPGYARADISELERHTEIFVGEIKLIEPKLPCGKTYRERNKECEEIWKKFREEEKRGLHKIPPKKNFDKNGNLISITYETPSPHIPCNSINGRNECAPAWCKTASRGGYVNKENVKESSGKLIDLLDDKHKENLNKISDSVRQLYEAFDALGEKENNFR